VGEIVLYIAIATAIVTLGGVAVVVAVERSVDYDLRAENERLREAITKVLEGFELGFFVRGTKGDAASDWAVKSYLVALWKLIAITGYKDALAAKEKRDAG